MNQTISRDLDLEVASLENLFFLILFFDECYVKEIYG